MADTKAATDLLESLTAAAEVLESVRDAEGRKKRAEDTCRSLQAKAEGLAKRVAELEALTKDEADIRAREHQTRQHCTAEIRAIEAQHAKDKARLKEEEQALSAELAQMADARQSAQGELDRLDREIAERKATLRKLVA